MYHAGLRIYQRSQHPGSERNLFQGHLPRYHIRLDDLGSSNNNRYFTFTTNPYPQEEQQ